ncbi:MAG: class I SAM-dependent methyltransferase [Kiritimatiellae bacterium]|nr:class I SAM-dependent methyltransferase [Kiritimatiellia bacterium]
MHSEHLCDICNASMRALFQKKVLGKYAVAYFGCDQCGYITTEKPYWLDEAYANAISDLDTGVLSRNLFFRDKLLPIFHGCPSNNGLYLDVSGGYGVFCRLMRDKGLNFFTTDPYCENLFAKGFEPDDASEAASDGTFQASVLTLFEVIEHVENPLVFLRELMQKYRADTLVFSTELYSGDFPDSSWWYYMFESGQHLSFMKESTLKVIASKLDLIHSRVEGNLHILKKEPFPPETAKIISKHKKAPQLIRKILEEHREDCLTWADHVYLKEKLLPQDGQDEA